MKNTRDMHSVVPLRYTFKYKILLFIDVYAVLFIDIYINTFEMDWKKTPSLKVLVNLMASRG